MKQNVRTAKAQQGVVQLSSIFVVGVDSQDGKLRMRLSVVDDLE
jgi:hypothetical protein